MSFLSIRERLSVTVLPFSKLAVADLAGKVLVFLTIPMITRRFGDGAFGDIGVASQLIVFAVLLGTSGLDVYSVRTIAQAPRAIGRWASTVVLMRLSLGLIVYAGLMLIALALPQYRPLALLVAVFGLSLLTRAIYLDWAAQALRLTNVLAVAMFGLQLVYFGLIVAAVALHTAVWTVALAQVLAEATAALGLLWWLRQHDIRLERPLPMSEWPDLLRQSMPFAGSQVLRGASLGLDLVVLSFLIVPREQIGWFSGAIKLYQLCAGTAAVYFLILLPRLSASAARSRAALNAELSHSLRVIVPLAMVTAVAVGLIARPLLRVVGGNAGFETAAVPLQVLLLAVVVGLINGHFRNALFALGRQHADFTNVGISTGAHLGLKLLLIPSIGILGAALGTLGGETVLTLLGWWSLRQQGSPPAGLVPTDHLRTPLPAAGGTPDE